MVRNNALHTGAANGESSRYEWQTTRVRAGLEPLPSGSGYARLNSVLTPGSNYVDFAVVSGQTYYYVVTAVDTTGLESEYSNQVTAVIPTP